MSIDQATYSKKKSNKERLIFVIKLILYVAILYVNNMDLHLAKGFEWVGKSLSALAFFLGANLVVSLCYLIILSWYIRKNKLKSLTRDNFILGINRISRVLNTTFIILAGLLFFGVDLTKIATGITIVAAAIAILSKDYIANMINGLIIMFSDQLSLGDHIKVNEYKGKILDITLVNVVLQNDDDDIILLPNSVLFTSVVVNQSKQNIKKMTIEFELDIKHAQSPHEVEAALKSAVAPYINNNITDNSFSLKTLEIKKDLVHFKVQLLLPNQNKETERKIKSELNTAILAVSNDSIVHENSK
ncbi:mechanosensitive ion channel-like protein [Chitinophaga skermanii]|uniref:Mechanosensitive ion channel-like protein n=1 Tax=Chitinophaga skermanii TaxID=331697 RepID=A0A327Q1A7_9BACT|nr:mechanosensitive ion channel domain-containing protein [Chitinophaga skermanii]RAI97537.1 mechanosensitive ion channel-like protein [Chitinophaga skermanii]